MQCKQKMTGVFVNGKYLQLLRCCIIYCIKFVATWLQLVAQVCHHSLVNRIMEKLSIQIVNFIGQAFGLFTFFYYS